MRFRASSRIFFDVNVSGWSLGLRRTMRRPRSPARREAAPSPLKTKKPRENPGALGTGCRSNRKEVLVGSWCAVVAAAGMLADTISAELF
jgi:hypothetical protein